MTYLTESQQEAQLRLFKSYLNKDAITIGSELITREDDLKQGIVYFGLEVPDSVRQLSLKMFGKKPEEWNSTFHKSFNTVLETPIEVLIAQQVIHYFTTYGLNYYVHFIFIAIIFELIILCILRVFLSIYSFNTLIRILINTNKTKS